MTADGDYRDLFRQSAAYLAANLLNAAVPFLLLPVLTRLLSPEEYGIYALFQVFVLLLAPVVGLNAHAAALRGFIDRSDRAYARLLGAALILPMTLMVVFAAIGFVIAPWIEGATGLGRGWLALVSVVAGSQAVGSVAESLWRMEERPRTYGLFLFSRTTGFFVLAVVAASRGMGWEGVVLSQLVTYALAAIAAFAMVRRWRPSLAGFAGSLRYIAKLGVPLIPHVIAGWALFSIDRLIVASLLGLDEAGVYSAAYQLAAVIGVVVTAFNNAWVPWFFRQMKTGTTTAEARVLRVVVGSATLLGAGAAGLWLLAPVFGPMILGADFAPAVVIVGPLAVSFGINGVYRFGSNYHFYWENTRVLSAVTVTAVALNIPLNLVLIPRYGLEGAAWATVSAMAVSAVLTWMLVLRRAPLPMGRAILDPLRSTRPLDVGREAAVGTVDRVYEELALELDGPNGDFVRVRAQYLAGLGQRRRLTRAARQILAGFVVPTVVLRVLAGRRPRSVPVDRVAAVNAPEHEIPFEDVVPVSNRGLYLSARDARSIVAGLWGAGCRAPEVYVRTLRSCADLGWLLARHEPSEVFVFQEFDYTISAGRWLANRHGAVLSNVMHGDKAFNPRDSFFHVDRYHVWHPAYARIAQELRARVDEVLVYRPVRFGNGNVSSGEGVGLLWPSYELSRDEAAAFAGMVENLAQRIPNLIIRPHPRYQPNPELHKLLDDAIVSTPDEPYLEFLERCSVLMGFVSTGLIEAAEHGIESYALIDSRFEKVRDYHPYFGVTVPGVAISEVPNLLTREHSSSDLV